MNRTYHAILVSGEPSAVDRIAGLIRSMGLKVVDAGCDTTGHQTVLIPPTCSDPCWGAHSDEQTVKKGIIQRLYELKDQNVFGYDAFFFTEVTYGNPPQRQGDFDRRCIVIGGGIPSNLADWKER